MAWPSCLVKAEVTVFGRSFDLGYEMGGFHFTQNLFMCQILENGKKMLIKILKHLIHM